jgi:uncharacterized protein
MATSLYDLSVPTFLQTVKAVGGFLDRAAKHCAQTRADPNDFVHARLFDDMAPFHFQIEAAWHHSVWGLEAVKTGAFAPPALVGPGPFAGLQAMIGKAETALEAFTPGHPGRPVHFPESRSSNIRVSSSTSGGSTPFSSNFHLKEFASLALL